MADENTYTCDECGGTFVYGRSDEDAHAEAVENFGKCGDDPGMAIVCDDCYQKIMRGLAGDPSVLRIQ